MRVELDSLLGQQEPSASFHDASLVSLQIAYKAATLIAEFSLFTNGPTDAGNRSHERRRPGRLRLGGLLHWSLEPFAEGGPLKGPHWLASDGLLDTAPTKTGLAIAASLTEPCFAWYLYFSDLNTFAYCASHRADFEWL